MIRSIRAALAAIIIAIASVAVAPAPAAEAAEAKIVRLTIVSVSDTTNDSSSSMSGHSFLMFKNISAVPQTIIIGVTGINVGKTITVGTWGNRADGKGIYYNLEAYFGAAGFPGRVSASVDITGDQLVAINRYIRQNNDWSELNNCSAFAEMAWYQSVRPAPSAGSPRTPKGLVAGIKSLSIGYTKNVTMPSVPISKVLRQDGTSSYHTAKL